MEPSPVLVATALAGSALVIGISKAGFGSGVGIMAAPLAAVAVGSEKMLGVLLPVLIAGDVFSIVHYLRARDVRNLAMLLPGSAAGIVAGTLVLAWFRGLGCGAELLDGTVGAVCIVFIGMQTALLVRRRWPRRAGTSGGPNNPPYRPATWHGVLVGAVAGLTSTLSHAAGPVIAMFLLVQRPDKRVFVGTTAWFFFGCNLMKLPTFISGGILTVGTLGYLAYLAPVVFAGTLLGVWMNRRVPARAFSCVIYVLVLLTGVKLLAGLLG